MGEGLDSNAVIGVVAAGWHPGEVFSISVIPKDGTAKSGWILFICTTLHRSGINCTFVIMMSHALYMYVRMQSCPYLQILPVAKSDCAQGL